MSGRDDEAREIRRDRTVAWYARSDRVGNGPGVSASVRCRRGLTDGWRMRRECGNVNVGGTGDAFGETAWDARRGRRETVACDV